MNIKAIISLAVSLIIGIAAIVGVSLDEGVVSTVVGGAAMAAVIVWDCWKNHNFTPAAQSAQTVLDAIKDGSITADEVEAIMAVNAQADGQGQ